MTSLIRTYRRAAVAATLVAASVAGISTTVQAAQEGPPERSAAGAPGSGDPYFPYAGNGGYDVLHYDLSLRYAPPSDPAVLVGKLTAEATITLRATEDLDALNFDLRGLAV
ncbi:MAG: Peptidase rane alanine aminopeptidase, partial [Pseudarthrobacter sp.]|nr:Peptidase rane alanine aminopeptidase [Pseudarthrobacter sp.]